MSAVDSSPVHRARRRPPVVVCATVILISLVTVALAAPVLAPYDPLASIGPALAPPSTQFPFGTDDLGRDQLSRMMYGARTSLFVGALTTLAALSAGTLLALLATFSGRLVGGFILRCADVLLPFPALLLALAVVAILGPGLPQALTAVAISLVPGYIRTVRSYIIDIQHRDFVAAARGMGAHHLWIVARHIVPGITGGLIVLFTLGVALVTLDVGALSFVGLGAQPPAPEWGSMLAAGREFIGVAWWLTIAPVVGVIALIFSVNTVGDWLRDKVDRTSSI